MYVLLLVVIFAATASLETWFKASDGTDQTLKRFWTVLAAPINSYPFDYPENGGTTVAQVSNVGLRIVYAVAVLVVPQVVQGLSTLQMWYLRVQWRATVSEIYRSDVASQYSSWTKALPYCLSARCSLEAHHILSSFLLALLVGGTYVC